MGEALEPMGAMTMRRMMGGATLYLDGTIFAIVHDDQLWLKADADSNAQWDAIGAPRFTVEMKGKPMAMNYRRAPDDVYDDADAMRHWAALAVEAGARGRVKRKARRAD